MPPPPQSPVARLAVFLPYASPKRFPPLAILHCSRVVITPCCILHGCFRVMLIFPSPPFLTQPFFSGCSARASADDRGRFCLPPLLTSHGAGGFPLLPANHFFFLSCRSPLSRRSLDFPCGRCCFPAARGLRLVQPRGFFFYEKRQAPISDLFPSP